MLIGGLLAGVLYSLVALGFVLIFKASGVFNFAQGAMVLFAALTLVRLDGGMPLWVAFAAQLRASWSRSPSRSSASVLRPLVNQEGIILFMATLGIAFFLDGFGQTIWGSDIYTLELGIPTSPLFVLESPFEGGVLIDQLDCLRRRGRRRAGRRCWRCSSRRRTTGRALRAVADDHQAAQSIGIPLNHIWVIVWAVAGIVALVAGMVWGAKLGVQFSLALVALKALPVLILGGFTSVPGAIIGGLIIGAGEKLAEVYLGPVLGGGIENWFAYMLALVFLLFRPQGLFGERIIERV